jgi:adenosylcobinamide-phosphate synthase
MITALILITAYFLDKYLGEAPRFHPLIGFGNIANFIEKKCNFSNKTTAETKTGKNFNQLKLRLIGSLSWLLLCLPLPLIYYFQHEDSWHYWLIDCLVLYLAIGLNSLKKHALQIHQPLEENNIDQARYFCGYLVSRKTSKLSEQEISRATVESVLENGHDAVIASLFWFIIGGAPLVILHRLANTLDAMWGYKNQHFLHFGWCAARMDDLLGYPSAKITAFLYAIQKVYSTKLMINSLRNGYQQSQHYKSLNGGWVMATGATILNVKLGGTAIYHGKTIESPTLGCGNNVDKKAIASSILLIEHTTLTLLALYSVYEFLQVLVK